MITTVVDRLHAEFKLLLSLLDDINEISLHITVDENFRKSLLLSAASYFERQITDDLLQFVEEHSNNNNLITSFVKNKAISRQYHTLFNWDAKNANQFFGLFGEGFKNHMQNSIENDSGLESAIKAFLEIGRERNRLVHQDYGAFSLEKTADEIYEMYLRAIQFVQILPLKLREI